MLLLGRSGALYATGTTFRIDELKFDNHQSNLAAARREYRAAALRAGFPPGETVNFDAKPIELDAALAESDGPVILGPDGMQVRWSPTSDALAPFESYLAERAELLADPPVRRLMLSRGLTRRLAQRLGERRRHVERDRQGLQRARVVVAHGRRERDVDDVAVAEPVIAQDLRVGVGHRGGVAADLLGELHHGDLGVGQVGVVEVARDPLDLGVIHDLAGHARRGRGGTRPS